jgi:LCP family protein required for cell wall assembly
LEHLRQRRREPRPSSATSVALLSFLWPGLGHWRVGRARTGLVFAVPVAIAGVALFLQALSGIERFAVLLISPSSALTILVLVILIGIWRLIALADSLVGIRSGNRRQGLAVAVALSVVIVASHLWVGWVAWAFYDAGSKIFVSAGPDAVPTATNSSEPGETPDNEFLATPNATPQTAAERINILLTGVDSAEERNHALTDTMIVVSVDPTTHAVAMISFPRDISNFPLWDGRTFPGKINSLMTQARLHPDRYPDGPLPTLIKELSFLLGTPIHYYAAVDLAGFRKMIDAVGGVDVVVAKSLNDQRYDWMDGRRGFKISKGHHLLDGETALAYVRSRFSPGDNDFNRSRRQQQVLVALRAKLTSPQMLPKIPELVGLAGDTIRTNFPTDRLDEMLTIANNVDDESIVQKVLGPPYALHPPSSTTGGIYTLQLDMERLAKLSIELFGNQSAYLNQ